MIKVLENMLFLYKAVIVNLPECTLILITRVPGCGLHYHCVAGQLCGQCPALRGLHDCQIVSYICFLSLSLFTNARSHTMCSRVWLVGKQP